MKPLIFPPIFLGILSPFNSGLEAQINSSIFHEVYLAQENLNEKAKEYLNEAEIIFKEGLKVEESNFPIAKKIIKNMTYVIKKDQTNFQAYSYRARAKNVLGKSEEAISDATKSLMINESYDAYYARGFAYKNIDKNLEANDDYDKALDIKPKDTNSLYLRAQIKYSLNDKKGSISEYSKIIEINPQYPDVFLSRGFAFMEVDDYVNALSDFSKAIELSPKDNRPWIWRGIVYTEFEDYKNALNDFSDVIELDPNNFYAFFLRW